jgi:AraC-like DNA-binding protein
VIFVITAGFRRIRRFNKTIRQLYADTDHREIKYIPTLLLIFILTSMLSTIVNFIGRQFFVDSLIVALPSIGFSALLAALIWLGTKHRFTIHDIPQDQEDETIDSDTKADSVPTAQSAQIYIKLENIMNEQQTFLQQDVLLNDVAKLLGTNRTYLLRALSSCAHMTFKEYVNRKRIAHAEQLIASNPTMPKSEVATLSGYNSLSSFYRNYNTYKKENR